MNNKVEKHYKLYRRYWLYVVATHKAQVRKGRKAVKPQKEALW